MGAGASAGEVPDWAKKVDYMSHALTWKGEVLAGDLEDAKAVQPRKAKAKPRGSRDGGSRDGGRPKTPVPALELSALGGGPAEERGGKRRDSVGSSKSRQSDRSRASSSRSSKSNKSSRSSKSSSRSRGERKAERWKQSQQSRYLDPTHWRQAHNPRQLPGEPLQRKATPAGSRVMIGGRAEASRKERRAKELEHERRRAQ